MDKNSEKNGDHSRRRECNKHDRMPQENDTLKVCETCETHYYQCDLCRRARDVPASACKYFIVLLFSKCLFVIFDQKVIVKHK
jgi:hypothetical protein